MKNHSEKKRETSIRSAFEAGRNMLTVLGGRESVIQILEDSSHPKAQALIDRLSSKLYLDENFTTSYTSVGLKALDVLAIFQDVQQARVFISALQEGDEVMRSLIRAAKDDISECQSTNCEEGWLIDRESGERTEKRHPKCKGTGYVLQKGSRESQQLYFELLKWKESGGLVRIDARKQQAFFGPGNIPPGFAVPPGETPDVLAIIRKADQVLLSPVTQSSPPPIDTTTNMPEEAMEGEPV